MKSKLIKIGVISLAILFSVFNFTYAANPMDIYNVNNNVFPGICFSLPGIVETLLWFVKNPKSIHLFVLKRTVSG